MPPPPKRRLPVWAMGLANAPTGFVYGFITTAMGILLVARGVSIDRIATVSLIAFSPTAWGWLLAPALDVRFTKRAYAFFFAASAAVLLALTLLVAASITLFTLCLTLACLCAVLYMTAVQSWAPDMVTGAEYDTISGWLNVANLGAAGVFGTLSVLLIRAVPAIPAALLLGLLVFAPSLLLLWFPAPPQPDGRLAANFRAMTRDLRRVLREGRVWVGLLIFVSPVCFALTNLFSSFGADFHTSERAVTALGGAGVAIACSLGCLLAIPLCRRFPRRAVYLLSGAGAAAACLFLVALPHTLVFFAIGLLTYNFFQGFNYTAQTALQLEIIGPSNALAGTMMAVLCASYNIPLSSMTKLDGWVHDRFGLNAMLLTDAGAALLAIVILLPFLLPAIDRSMQRRDKPIVV